jgi:hypothetical protein
LLLEAHGASLAAAAEPTLNRRFAAEGMSFMHVWEEARHTLALSALRMGGLLTRNRIAPKAVEDGRGSAP